MKDKKLGILAMTAVCIFWGAAFLSIKVVGTTLGPVTFSFLRFSIAGIIFAFIYKVQCGGEKIAKEDYKKLVFNAIIGIPVYFTLQNIAIPMIPATDSSVISAMQPIIMLIAEALFLSVAITRKKAVAVALCVVGAVITVGQISLGGSMLGYVLMLVATCLWVAYSILQQPLNKKYNAVTINFYQFIVGAIIMSPAIFIENNVWSEMTFMKWANVAYLGIFCSGVCFVLYNFAIERIGATISSLFLNAGPIITMVLSFFLLKEPILINQLIGAVLVISGVTLATVNFKKKKEKNDVAA